MTIQEAGGLRGGSMYAVMLYPPGSIDDLRVEEVPIPEPGAGEALVRVVAAAITKDELTWPVDRLPAVPSYELSGVVAALGAGVDSVAPGDAVFALSRFDRDGAAAGFIALPAMLLAPKPERLDGASSAALPLAALSAWQGLFDHGELEVRQRVLILGGAGGVGHLATQLARWRGAYVIATAPSRSIQDLPRFGADEALDGADAEALGSLGKVDLVFDTVGGDALARSMGVVREDGRVVSVAEEPPPVPDGMSMETVYFVVEPNRAQLIEVARLADAGALRPEIDAVFPLSDAVAAFRRSLERGKRGKVVLQIGDDGDA
jgi:NADPH:quinone reductase-like Zn-dependent oxidoreductase